MQSEDRDARSVISSASPFVPVALALKAVAVSALISLASCSGGGGGSPAPVTSSFPVPSPTPVVSSKPKPSPTPVASSTPGSTPTPIGSGTPVATPTPVPSTTPKATPTPLPSVTPKPTPTPIPSSTPAPTPTPSSTPANGLPPQPNSVYLGAWAKPANAPPAWTSSQNIAALEASIGRKFAISLHYDGMTVPFPTADEQTDLANGRVPLVSLNCNDTDYNIAHGSQDAVLAAKAAAIKAFGRPVLVRYKWEFNLTDLVLGREKCADPTRDLNGYFSPLEYIAAFQHIHDLMLAQGASNIVWVWNPSSGGASGIPYFPGDAYVNWVGIDVYDRHSGGTSIFATPYALYAPVGNATHPVIIGETGAIAQDQPNFLNAAAPATLKTLYPQIKALVYFDAVGPLDDYSFTAPGLAAFTQFAADPYLGALP